MDFTNIENEEKYSDMMRRYFETKKKYPDCYLLYRLGDFYELFFDDAEKASKILDLVLTSRDCGKEVPRAPMCGMPYHAVDSYISKLVATGAKVAICEQLEEAKPNSKEIIKRDVIRIVTAGTITDESIDEKTNNFVCAVYYGKSECAFSWCDITTGQFFVRKCTSGDFESEISDNLVRISPAEIICNKRAGAAFGNLPVVRHQILPTFNLYNESSFSSEEAGGYLAKQFDNSIPAIVNSDDEMKIACGVLVAYITDTQKQALINIARITVENSSDYMELDANAIKNLEIVKTNRDNKRYGSLLWLLDKTSTSMGARNLRSWLLTPLADKNKIDYRLDGVEELASNAILRGGLTDNLSGIRDIERISGKIAGHAIMPYDCILLAKSLAVFPAIKMLLFGVKSKILKDVDDNVTDFTELCNLLFSAINQDKSSYVLKDGGYIREGFDKELDRLRDIKKNAGAEIKKIEERERERTGIKNLKVDFNRVFGYYIEVTNSFKSLVPFDYVRKQTLVGSERYITEELKKLEEDILTSEDRAKKIERDIYKKITDILCDQVKKILRSSRSIACLDTLVSFATVAKKNNYVRPEILDSGETLNIVGGRHPVVEAISNEKFISNDALMDNDENRVLIITGPNMAGKSTYMRQNALIAIMAQTGCFVPAKSAEIPVIDRVFTRIGASDNLILDQSTFLVEMTEVASILCNATEKSLLILDEVGRGTSTYDGLSIAWAVVEYIAKTTRAKTLFATHYHELSELEGVIEGIKNYKITVKEVDGSIVFLRQIVRGSANRSFGIEVASLAGIPKAVTMRAKQILKSLEQNDLTKKYAPMEAEEIETEPAKSEIEEAVRDIDINSTTPFEALKFLSKLKGMLD
ncbi:MAG: DNA mismatch repair protein MutS [Clostridia bacterium]|nr:DNA mismatch repair protein MutS [Clostridia bacterium]